MVASADTRGSLLIALYSFQKKERSGSLTKDFRDGFLWRLEVAVRDKAISKNDSEFISVLASVHTSQEANRRRKEKVKRRIT
jgi:hypothetical protein